MKPGDRVILSQNCRHEYARGAIGTIKRVIKARGGNVTVILSDGRLYEAKIANVAAQPGFTVSQT